MVLEDVGPYGHVAWVESVNCSARTVTVSEMNCCERDTKNPGRYVCGTTSFDEATARAIGGPRTKTYQMSARRKYIVARTATPLAKDPCSSGTPGPTPTPTPTPTPPTGTLQIASISPTSVVGSSFDLTIDGQGFDGATTDMVYKSNGQYMGSGTRLSQTATRLVVRESMAGAAPGPYTIKVKNGTGQLSNGATLTLRSEVSVSPSTGSAGTTFTLSGRG
jgi:hypothetical protein